MTKPVQLGVLGGSGVYNVDGVTPVKTHAMDTPFGKPSDPVVEAEIEGRKVFFIPRHGIGHRLLPSEVPYAANMYALKSLGVTHVMAVSAVGIMQDHIEPGHMVVPDQIYDRTKGMRRSTFFGNGCAGHVMFADPFCDEMRQTIIKAAKECGAKVHEGGTYVCMEGPQFSTRAESHAYRKILSPTVIGMTAIPEAKLAREAEMSYGMLALATDYDCWKESEDDVTVEAVMAVLKANSAMASRIVKTTSQALPSESSAASLSAAAHAIMTQRDLIPVKTKADLKVIFGRYLD